jgi:hypothetical protein
LLFVKPKAYLLHYFPIYSLKQTAVGLLDKKQKEDADYFWMENETEAG